MSSDFQSTTNPLPPDSLVRMHEQDGAILRPPTGGRRISTDPPLQPQPSPPICGVHSQRATVRLKQRSFFMGLLERVSTLIRANINDVIDRAEDPEKIIKQVILEME